MNFLTEANASVNMDFVSCFFLDKKNIAFYGAPIATTATPSALNDYSNAPTVEVPLICRFMYEDTDAAAAAYKRITSDMKQSKLSIT